jgi:hypothetical protein
MISMMRILLALAMAAGAAFAADWKPLFNGKDLSGWEHVGPGSFTVEDGMLRTHGGMGLLWYTREKFGNTTLRVVFKTTGPVDNSGLFIRFPEPPKDPWYLNYAHNQPSGRWPRPVDAARG